MAARLNPYLNFPGTARAAMEFYQSVLGGELTLSTFGEFGGEPADGIMHAQLTTPLGFTIMASDLPEGIPHQPGTNVSLSISGEGDADTLRGYFAALSEDGRIEMPLEKQVWGDEFGACTDKFGINWMVNIGEDG